MYIMTFETPDAEVFKKAANYLKKLNVKIKVVEQDQDNLIGENDDEFDKAWRDAQLTGVHSDNLVDEVIKNVGHLFDQEGENIHLKGIRKV